MNAKLNAEKIYESFYITNIQHFIQPRALKIENINRKPAFNVLEGSRMFSNISFAYI